MEVSSTGTLIGIIFIAICVFVLIGIGIATIRSGHASLTRAHIANQEVVWHRQITFLFGLCNLVFAALLILVMLLMVVVIQIIKLVVFILLSIVFVLSMVLIVRCILVGLQPAHSAVSPPLDKE